VLPNKPLNIVVVGGGGREHALCWKLAQSAHVDKVFCLPGNGGTAKTDKVTNVDVDVMDFAAIAKLCLDVQSDLVVIGPDNPLSEGIVDVLQESGLRVFGPDRKSACLEWSKVFAKQFMQQGNIPTARFAFANSLEKAEKIVLENDWARVIKVDGLALGKGVFVCDSIDEAKDALKTIFLDKRFGDAGSQVVIEEKLFGPEVSLMTLYDGVDLVPLLPSCDHKRRFDEDKGPNTGGMGVYAPTDLYKQRQEEIERLVLAPLAKALKDAEFAYKGVVYIGLMMAEKPYVLEFNARFGDPETQAVLPLMESDLLPALWACTEGKLSQVKIAWSKNHSCCVVACAKRYPESGSSGEVIEIGDIDSNAVVFQAGTKVKDGTLVTNGGRILSVVGIGQSMESAVDYAYEAMTKVKFAGKAYRHDIARRAVAPCQ
jgi:phosphoribosylamine--glycine ligase